jgi:hypothetical protein
MAIVWFVVSLVWFFGFGKIALGVIWLVIGIFELTAAILMYRKEHK